MAGVSGASGAEPTPQPVQTIQTAVAEPMPNDSDRSRGTWANWDWQKWSGSASWDQQWDTGYNRGWGGIWAHCGGQDVWRPNRSHNSADTAREEEELAGQARGTDLPQDQPSLANPYDIANFVTREIPSDVEGIRIYQSLPAFAAPRTAPHDRPLDAIVIHNPAVAEPASDGTGERYDLAYFRYYCERYCLRGYKQHSAALKYFRDSSEALGSHEVCFDNTAVAEVPGLIHSEGELYSFDPDNTYPWRWQEMVAQLDDGDIKSILRLYGQYGYLDGYFTRCTLMETNKIDRYRHTALRKHGKGQPPEMLKIWSFMLYRNDGVVVSLHPNYSNTSVGCGIYEEDTQPSTDHEMLANGKGGSDGPDTFKYYKNKRIQHLLKFDASKSTNSGKGKDDGKGKNKGIGKGKDDDKGKNSRG